ncbi:hypothetical protein SMD11_0032 [Streptomyces albireticuli]|uniref:Uncharacterized protein n=1 Tax=Streptomyces albireticuli TaxID=1940 RepID=A0A1Z2KUK3_9ACTN|nr:hypothetical protein SMD11_0032 [Streptomyces albireticuli]
MQRAQDRSWAQRPDGLQQPSSGWSYRALTSASVPARTRGLPKPSASGLDGVR